MRLDVRRGPAPPTPRVCEGCGRREFTLITDRLLDGTTVWNRAVCPTCEWDEVVPRPRPIPATRRVA